LKPPLDEITLPVVQAQSGVQSIAIVPAISDSYACENVSIRNSCSKSEIRTHRPSTSNFGIIHQILSIHIRSEKLLAWTSLPTGQLETHRIAVRGELIVQWLIFFWNSTVVPAYMSVATGPGLTALTVALSENSRAQDLVMDSRAALVPP
jgi:hypothetical protein